MASRTQSREQQRLSVSRRDFLRVSGLSVVGLSVSESAAAAQLRRRAAERSCIFLLMTGGPGQIDTFDPKPEAPAEIRGPLRTIATSVPGIQLSEGFPRLAERMQHAAILRSLTHTAAPIHETGLQLVQTGRLSGRGVTHPHIGAAAASVLGPRNNVAPFVMLRKPVDHTGVQTYRGQGAGYLGDEFAPLTARDASADSAEGDNPLLDSFCDGEPEAVRQMYGDTHFGRLCLQARHLVECGVRCVTINLFDSLAQPLTWDCHGRGAAYSSSLYDYRDRLCPEFDRAFCALMDDLQQRGLWKETLLVAVGEMGRTPKVNDFAGRDHWPAVWSAVLAGGGIASGQVIGASDSRGGAVADRPIAPGELIASVAQWLGIDPATRLPMSAESSLPIADHPPIAELRIV